MTISLFTVAVLSASFFVGFLPALIDGARKALQERLKLNDGDADWFARVFYLVWLPAMPVAGWMLDAFHNKEILFFGLVGMILSLAWLTMAANLHTLYLNAIVLGLSYSCVVTAAISFMPRAFFPDYVDSYRLNIAALNVGFIAVGIGAALGAWIAPRLQNWFGLGQGILYVSTALIAPAAMTALVERDAFPPTVANVTWPEMVAGPHLLLLALVLLVYFALENCLDYWPKTLQETPPDEIKPHEADVAPAEAQPVFWFLFIASRGLAAWHFYHHPNHGAATTVALVFVSTLILFNVVSGFEFGGERLLLWMVGLCYGPLLPGFLGMALDLYLNALPLSVLGILLAFSGIDTLLVRPAMTYFTLNRTPRSVLWAPLGLSLVLWIPLVFFVIVRVPR